MPCSKRLLLNLMSSGRALLSGENGGEHTDDLRTALRPHLIASRHPLSTFTRDSIRIRSAVKAKACSWCQRTWADRELCWGTASDPTRLSQV